MIEFKYDASKVSQVPIDDVQPNDYNPKERGSDKQKNIQSGLEKKGLLAPIFVRETKNGFEIVDGEQRWTSLKASGNDKALIYNLGKISDQEAKEMTMWFEEQVPFDRVLQAELVKSMVDTYDNLQLPYSDDEIDNMIKILEYDPNALEDEETEDPMKDEFDKLVVKLTKDQLELIRTVIDFVKEEYDCSDGRALELICADFQAGNFSDSMAAEKEEA